MSSALSSPCLGNSIVLTTCEEGGTITRQISSEKSFHMTVAFFSFPCAIVGRLMNGQDGFD